jgi:hypothetical protein
MYNTKFVCTYKSYADPFLSDTFYRKDLLNIFSIEDLDFEKHEDEIQEEIIEIFDKICKYKNFMVCIQKAGALFSVDDLAVGFMILMSYDFLYLTHECISEFLENETISDDKIKKLLENLEK